MNAESKRPVLLLVLFALGGCGESLAPVASQRQAIEERSYARYLDFQEEWIEDGCPRLPLAMLPPETGEAGTWLGERVFSAALLDPERPPAYDPVASGRLAGYCLFRWRPSAQHPDAYRPYSDTKQTGPLLEEEDADVVSELEPVPAWDASARLDRPAIEKALRGTAHALWDLDDAAYAAVHPEAPVRVALIDNGPYGSHGEVAPDDAPHVRSVANVVREVACPDGEAGPRPCAASLSSHLALPHVTPDQTSYQKGGYFGKRSQVAAAIWDAVMQAGREQHRVILNLSIGWHGEGRLGAADLAVRDAIAFARCRGHLVIAAAGNRADVFDESKGPLRPGAFETMHAMTPEQCERSFRVQSTAPREDDDTYLPLVFAVGATDARDRPLLSARALGRPALAAHAHGVLTGDTMPDPLELAPASGSSFATAAVSGIAALVWAARPGLPAGTVMEILYRTGVDLTGTRGDAPDFSLGSPRVPLRTEIHRVSMCRSVLLATGDDPDRCNTPRAQRGRPFPIRNLWQVAPTDQGTATTLDPDDLIKWTDAAADTVVLAPWAGPQPTSPGCSTCRVLNLNVAPTPGGSTPAELEISLTPELLASAPNTTLLLTLESSGGTHVQVITPPPGVRNFTVPIGAKGAVERASLTFRHEAAGEVFDTYEQILVQ